jgi:hypothetical protein
LLKRENLPAKYQEQTLIGSLEEKRSVQSLGRFGSDVKLDAFALGSAAIYLAEIFN